MIPLFGDYTLLTSNYVLAAKTVVVEYKIFNESIAVDELSTFARTGKLSNSLRINLALARKEPQVIRQYLTTPVQVSPIFLDRVLNSPVGDIILDELSQVIHTPSRKADRQALRSALVLSAAGDEQVSLIEIIQNYPTPDVKVDGEHLENAYRQLRKLQTGLENFLR
jgi:hypothetical protein